MMHTLQMPAETWPGQYLFYGSLCISSSSIQELLESCDLQQRPVSAASLATGQIAWQIHVCSSATL